MPVLGALCVLGRGHSKRVTLTLMGPLLLCQIPVPGPRLAASLMGNQLDRITHLNYSELPTGDPSGIEKDELRVGVAYFFSDEEEDLDERGQPDKFGVKATAGCSPCPESPDHHHHHHHHLLHQLVLNETQFSAFRGQECIFSKVSGGPQGADLSVYAVSALPALCAPGDLLELLWLQPAPEPAAPAPHWAVYVGGGHIIHLHQGEIRQDSLYEAGAANVGRVVNSWYRYRPLVAELVVQNACGHLGLKREEICWTNSESFAAWCRFGKREFKAGGEVQAGTQPPQQQVLSQSAPGREQGAHCSLPQPRRPHPREAPHRCQRPPARAAGVRRLRARQGVAAGAAHPAPGTSPSRGRGVCAPPHARPEPPEVNAGAAA